MIKDAALAKEIHAKLGELAAKAYQAGEKLLASRIRGTRNRLLNMVQHNDAPVSVEQVEAFLNAAEKQGIGAGIIEDIRSDLQQAVSTGQSDVAANKSRPVSRSSR